MTFVASVVSGNCAPSILGDVFGGVVEGALRGGINGGVRSTLGAVGLYPSCFQCREKCITYSYRCDGEVDCYGAEDEAGCDYICPYETHHRCSDTGLCIDNHDLCDGHYDCQNGEDESNCGRPWFGKHGPIPIFTGKAVKKSLLLSNQLTETEDIRQDNWSSLGYRSNSTIDEKRLHHPFPHLDTVIKLEKKKDEK